MTEEHPNISLLKRLDRRDMAAAGDLFAPDVVWHYFNPKLPDMQGDYVGLSGIGAFLATLGARTGGTFKVKPVSATPVGDEMVAMQTRNTMTLEDQAVATDVVVVWRRPHRRGLGHPIRLHGSKGRIAVHRTGLTRKTDIVALRRGRRRAQDVCYSFRRALD